MKSPADEYSLASRGLAVDRELVRRVVLSSAFAKSPRLSHFLRYICTEADEGRQQLISEQRIGTTVFGRDVDYDSTADSIVRSHASRLRHRLREYFETEGVHETVILTIPKGSYVPRFALRVEEDGVRTETETPLRPAQNEPLLSVESFSESGLPQGAPSTKSAAISTNRIWKIAAIGMTVIAVTLGAVMIHHLSGPRHNRHHIFWSGFLDPRQGRTTMVEADSGLVMLQHFTRRPVSLASYINGDYLRDVSAPDEKPDTILRLGSRRYTPAVDGAIYDKLSHLLPETQQNLSLSYARDLRLNDLKQGNAVLLGTHESNPWVELFESSMNFTFRNDLAAGTTAMVNRQPRAGEQALYPMLSNDPEHTVYGLVAYRPNLTRTGHVLIVEGETMAGTQTASEFLLDDRHLLPFLKSIQKSDGSVPHFEVLIRSSSLGGESSRIDQVAFRVDPD